MYLVFIISNTYQNTLVSFGYMRYAILWSRKLQGKGKRGQYCCSRDQIPLNNFHQNSNKILLDSINYNPRTCYPHTACFPRFHNYLK